MNINNYEIEFARTDQIDLKNYMSVFRYFLYNSQQHLAPQKIAFQPELLEILEGEVFAHRLGLVMFKTAKGDLTPCTYKFNIVNDTDEIKSIYSGDLKAEGIEAINKVELLMRVPPRFNSFITVEFEPGRGTDHARFSLIEGYRMDSKDNFKIRFELNGQTVDNTINNFKTLLDKKICIE
jgi:hypothetical protein